MVDTIWLTRIVVINQGEHSASRDRSNQDGFESSFPGRFNVPEMEDGLF